MLQRCSQLQTEISAATKTAQEKINNKNWDHTNGQLLMIFESHGT
jgi:hypothetical protein